MSFRFESPSADPAFVGAFSFGAGQASQAGRAAAAIQIHRVGKGVVVIEMERAGHQIPPRVTAAARRRGREEADLLLLLLLLHPRGEAGYRLQRRRRRNSEGTRTEGGMRGRLKVIQTKPVLYQGQMREKIM